MSENSRASRQRCPRRGCAVTVPSHLFACLPDWNALPSFVQQAINRTSRMNLLSQPRREAIAAARRAWDAMS